MLQATDICKGYGERLVLDQVSLSFADTGLVCILGRSGCGKTTLLNILGGLEGDFEGELEIDGRSTRGFLETDWDRYRGQDVGFVFQDASLIGYLSVGDNVRCALDLKNISSPEVEGPVGGDPDAAVAQALEAVGLGDFQDRMPSELSGGEIQRVAIARAIVKGPRILLADEPTGSLDLASGEDVMCTLSTIAQDCLVVIVTHDQGLAERYADRIIKLGEGTVESDLTRSGPVSDACGSRAAKADNAGDGGLGGLRRPRHPGRAGMFARLIRQHLGNKLQRALITLLVATIGITGTGLTFAVQSGAHAYMDRIGIASLASNPLVLRQNGTQASLVGVALSALDTLHGNDQQGGDAPSEVTLSHVAQKVAATALAHSKKSDLEQFMRYVDSDRSHIRQNAYDVQRHYDVGINLYDANGRQIVQDGRVTILDNLSLDHIFGKDGERAVSDILPDAASLLREIPYNEETGASPYEVMAGHMPNSYDEAVIICDHDGRVSDYFAYATGLADLEGIREVSVDLMMGKDVRIPGLDDAYSFERLLGLEFDIVPQSDYYYKGDGGWDLANGNARRMKDVLASAPKLRIVGVVRASDKIASVPEVGAIGYSSELIPWVIDHNSSSEIARQQAGSPNVDVFTGVDFASESRGSNRAIEAERTRNALLSAIDSSLLSQRKLDYLKSLNDEQVMALGDRFKDYFDASGRLYVSQDDVRKVAALPDDQFTAIIESYAPATLNHAYQENMDKLGVADLHEPTSIQIFPSSVEGREQIIRELDSYNATLADGEAPVTYASLNQAEVDQVTSVINLVSWALIILMILALGLSAIMIFSVTSVAVIERRREIGILRALGASRRDVVLLFCWENVTVGMCAGILGALFALLLSVPLSLVVQSLTKEAALVSPSPLIIPVSVVVGMTLSLVSGLTPTLRATQTDPAHALRQG